MIQKALWEFQVYSFKNNYCEAIIEISKLIGFSG